MSPFLIMMSASRPVLLGSLDDTNRNMRLVFDPQAEDWRVAWTPGDIFAEMSRGGQLRLEISVPSRANIYDKDGKILADQNGRIVTVHAIKQDIPDWPACLNVLRRPWGKTPPMCRKFTINRPRLADGTRHAGSRRL